MAVRSTIHPGSFKRRSTHRGSARRALHERYAARIEVDPALSRSLVSYQSNRRRPYYRWFQYREGFSAALVEHMLVRFSLPAGRVLDPFAGSGTALFASRNLGWHATGIELLPVGVFSMQARLAAPRVPPAAFRQAIHGLLAHWPRQQGDPSLAFGHLPITRGAFDHETEAAITRYRTYVRDAIRDPDVRLLFNAACLAVLERVSYTRKDGQYLRWDRRAPRPTGASSFCKGAIARFDDAVGRQLSEMLQDMSGDAEGAAPACAPGSIDMREGSCLDLLPSLGDGSYDLVITSPPYCNRYDYTRTYALELAFLGVGADGLKQLRQCLLSCTVENRAKEAMLRARYANAASHGLFERAMAAFEGQEALHEVLAVLQSKGLSGQLNNASLPRMVRNYFVESAVVIFELARIVRPGGRVIMVNDNVQYAGEEVPVDLILCDLAAAAGFSTRHIWTLQRGKGNSSQQMGLHGRNELRKCAYLWQLESPRP